jgi:hypothetical protein
MNGQVLGSQVNSSDVVVEAPPYIDHGDENLMEEPLYQASSVTGVSTVDGVVQTVPSMIEVAPQAKLESAAPLMSLLNHDESEGFRLRWNEIQAKFVDEPRTAVQQADGLVTDVVDQITKMFFREHGDLELQWKQGNEVSTEDLRQALQHYRSFFNRLVG